MTRKLDKARNQDMKPATGGSEPGLDRRSLLRGGALLAGGAAAGSFAAPLIASAPAKAQAGTFAPQGRQRLPIRNGKYPRSYFPNTEALGATEMRITALGTGMPNVITKRQKSSCWLVELGNGDIFLFDLGTGSMENLGALRPDWSRVDKVFVSHLHSDHVGDFPGLYIGGWMNGRYTPLNVYGPSGAKKEHGTAYFVEHQVKSWQWDVDGRRGGFPIQGGKAIAHEFDYKKEQAIYDKNGVKITMFPAIHVLDGPVSFRLDWGKRSFVFGGDSYPNKWFIKHSRGAEVVVHECFFAPETLQEIMDLPKRDAIYITSYIHTPPEAFGKIMSEIKPRMAVGYHFWMWHDVLPDTQDAVRKTYKGPLTLATDMIVWNVTDEKIVVREAVVDENVMPSGTTLKWKQAERTDPYKISKFINAGKWTGYKPPPLPKR